MTSLTQIPSTALIPEEPSPLHPANKAAIFDALEAAGIAYVDVPFHGSGDEGFVSDPTAYINTGSLESPQYSATALPRCSGPQSSGLWPDFIAVFGPNCVRLQGLLDPHYLRRSPNYVRPTRNHLGWPIISETDEPHIKPASPPPAFVP